MIKKLRQSQKIHHQKKFESIKDKAMKKYINNYIWLRYYNQTNVKHIKELNRRHGHIFPRANDVKRPDMECSGVFTGEGWVYMTNTTRHSSFISWSSSKPPFSLYSTISQQNNKIKIYLSSTKK